MSDIVNWMQQLPEPDRLALSTRYALLKALLEATHMRAEEIRPEHLLLGLIKQNDTRIAQMCDSLGLDLAAMYMRLILSEQPVVQEWSASYHKERFGRLNTGDVVEGVIVRIDQDEILVDIGLALEGILSTKELPATGYGSFNELHLNDKVLVYVLQSETPDGRVLLSSKQVLIERSWRIAEEQYRNDELLKARVIDCNKGGLIVDLSGIRGFVPISQILNLSREEVALGGDNQEAMAKLLNMKGKELQLKIIEINRERQRITLSERLAYQEWRQRRREELLDELKPGEIRRGVVSNIANFGIFVDLGGADGLVHTSQLAWRPVNHPSELFKVGLEVEVQVLSVDKEKKKIALSIKRAQVDPWKTVEQRYVPGQIVEESGEKNHVDDSWLFSYEESLKAAESTTSLDAGEGRESLPFSQESLECLDWAISFAKHIHSTVAHPDHLLLSILLQKRIQSFLAPLLPSSEALLAYFTGGITPGDAKSTSFQAGACPACKQSTLPSWKHCVYCGVSLARVCPKCGALYPDIEGARFCFECGGPLQE